MDEKPCGNILVHDVLYKNLIGAKPFRIIIDKLDGFITAYDGSSYLDLINLMLFSIGLDILKDQKLLKHMLILLIMQKSKLT